MQVSLVQLQLGNPSASTFKSCFQFEVARNCFIVISVCCHFSKEKIRAGTAGDHFQVKLDDRYDEGKKMETLKKVAEQLKNFAPSSVAVELDEDSDTE